MQLDGDGQQRGREDAADYLLLALSALRLVLPAVLFGLLVIEYSSILLSALFAKLQASSFGDSPRTSTFVAASSSSSNGHSHAGYTPVNSSSAAGNSHHSRGSVAVPPDENGVLPVVVPVSLTRRGLVYSLLSLLVLSYLVDGGIIVAHSILSNAWETLAPTWRHEEPYLLGCALVITFQTLTLAWQERSQGLGNFRKGYMVVMLVLTVAGEAALLGILGKMLRRSQHHTNRGHEAELVKDKWTVAHLTLLAARVVLALAALLSLSPLLKKRHYLPNEYSSLLNSNATTRPAQADERGSAAHFSGANGNAKGNARYGTFSTPNGSAPKPPSDDDAADGAATGAGGRKPDQTVNPLNQAPIPEHQKSFWSRIKILSPYLWPRKSRTLQCVALFCFVLLGVGRVVNLFVPKTLGAIVDDLNEKSSPWKHLLLYAFLRFLQGNGGLTQVLQSNLWIPVAQYSEREMSQMTFSHLLNLSLSFQVRKKTGEVLRTLDRGSAINSFFQTILFQLLPIAVDILVAIVYLWSTFGALLALLILVVMIAYVAASVVLTRLRVKLRRDMNDKDKYTRGIHADALANWETIKYFTAEERECTRYIGAMIDYQRAESKVIASLNFLNLTQNAIISFGLLVGCLIVAFSVVQGQRNVGQFVMFLTYLNQLYGPLNILGTLYRMIQMNITDTDNLMKLLAEETEINDAPSAVRLEEARGEIELDNVSFSYDGKVVALRDVSVHIKAGTSVALVGESGAGKSTLLRLLYRFYDVTGGTIRLDGHDIRQITQHSLRKAIGVVPQEAVLFNESIAYNIGYGKEGSSQEEIEDAARAARIYDRIQTFPERWDTKVGERGVRLSGGEKQRVSIARAILKNPAILLLDEATSALDTATEREIQTSLRGLAEGRTSIAIAHRLSTITYSDVILVLKDGRITERGDHKTLLGMRGTYWNLWNKQIRNEEASGADVEQDDDEGAAEVTPPGTSGGTNTPLVVGGHQHP